MTPEDYKALPPGEARAAARRMSPDAQLRLAVALSVNGPTYTYWLRVWRCPALPTALVVAGWEWGEDGLRNPTARIELACFGFEAIDRALQICFGGLGVNGKIKPHLDDAERAYLCRVRPGWEAEQEQPKGRKQVLHSEQMELDL